MKYIIKSILAMVFLTNMSLMANQTQELGTHLSKTLDSVIKIVKNKKASKDIRADKIISKISPMFDFALMAKLSLGKKVWRSLNAKKKKEFTHLYVTRMKKSYSQKIDSFTGQSILLDEVKQIKKNKITAKTYLVGKSSSDKTEVVYKFYKPKKLKKGKDKWLIYDVMILGVSIIKTDRSQFRQVLKNSTIDELMKKMEI